MKKMIALMMALSMTMAMASCTEAGDSGVSEKDRSFASASENVSDDTGEESVSASAETTTTSVTTTAEPETTTEQTTTTTSETTTTTTTEAPQLLPTISGSGTTMNNSVIINVTGDPNTGVITLNIENNSVGAVLLFGLPSLVVDGYSVALDPYANMTVMSNEVPANSKGLIELKAQPEQIKSGMRITGQLFSKDLSNFADKNLDITLG